MNLGITITGALLVAVCATPVVYFVASQKNQKKQLIQALKQLAAQHGCTIGHYELCAQLIIGIDGSAQRLFLIIKKDQQLIPHSLPLNAVAAVTLETVYGKNTALKVVEQLGLRFLPKKGHVSDLYWELYNSDDSFQLNGELQLAHSWIERIHKAL